MKADTMKLSIIIPAYNESRNIKNGSIEQVAQYLDEVKYSYEVLIIDDGSSDKTREMVKQHIKDKPNFHLIENEHGGKAITVMTGLLAAKGEIVLFTDMDQATPLDQIEKFFPKFDAGFDIVIGSRSGRQGAPLTRQLSAWGFSFLRNLILGLPFSDTQCGFKAFKHEAVQKIFPGMLTRWHDKTISGAAVNAGFDIEVLYVARKEGFKIADVPVVWHHVGSDRVPLLKSAIEAVKDLIRIRFSDIRGEF